MSDLPYVLVKSNGRPAYYEYDDADEMLLHDNGALVISGPNGQLRAFHAAGEWKIAQIGGTNGPVASEIERPR